MSVNNKTFKRFPCKVCGERPKSRVKKIRMFGICVECYNEIRDEHGRSSGQYSQIDVNCVICGTRQDKFGKLPICNNAGCRAVYYRLKYLRNQVHEAIKTNNIDSVYILRRPVKSLKQIGYTLKLEPIKKEVLQTV